MTRNKTLSLVTSAILAAMLSACGGGGGSDLVDDVKNDVKSAVQDVKNDLQAVEANVTHCPYNGAEGENQGNVGEITVAQANAPAGFQVKAAATALSTDKDGNYTWTWKPSSTNPRALFMSSGGAPTGTDYVHVGTFTGSGFVAGDVITIDLHVDRNGHEDAQHGNTTCTLTVK